MNRKLNIFRTSILGLMLLPGLTFGADVASSPWGSDDEIGRLNLITPESRRAALQNLNPAVTYDLSVEYFIGMPSWQAAGDPQFQMWMTHTPKGTKVDDPLFVGDRQNDRVSYSGSAFSMYAHTGTHIDALNHFGLNGKIWNHFSAAQHLGDRGWQKTGAENIPPIIARGVLLDVPAAKQVDELSPGYRITREDLEKTLVAGTPKSLWGCGTDPYRAHAPLYRRPTIHGECPGAWHGCSTLSG